MGQFEIYERQRTTPAEKRSTRTKSIYHARPFCLSEFNFSQFCFLTQLHSHPSYLSLSCLNLSGHFFFDLVFWKCRLERRSWDGSSAQGNPRRKLSPKTIRSQVFILENVNDIHPPKSLLFIFFYGRKYDWERNFFVESRWGKLMDI